MVALMLGSAGPCFGQAIYKSVRLFGFLESSSALATGALCEGTNGILYGTSLFGGPAKLGTVFGLGKNGGGLVVYKSFLGTNGDGSTPGRGLLLANNGLFYGTTTSGGESNQGTIFRIDHEGGNYAILKSFTGAMGDGASPPGPLMQASNGGIYGVTSDGGDSGQGTLFRLNADGSGYAILKSFSGGINDGAKPFGGLIEGTNGMLFGTTRLGGAKNQGAVFALNLDGSGYQVLRSFAGAPGDGGQPYAALTVGGDGLLYGTTYVGGVSSLGTVFRMNRDGSGYQVLKSFSASQGSNPVAPLVLGTNSVLYGSTYLGGAYGKGTLFQFDPNGGGFQLIKSFQNGGTDGAQPANALVMGSDGDLYGLTSSGGIGRVGTGTGSGTAYKLSLDGNGYTVIWNFSTTGGDGVSPQAPLLRATNGWLYGTAANGGAYGQGAVFRISSDGTGYGVLRSFEGTNQNPALPDGGRPYAGLAQGADGALYGTTSCDYVVRSGNSTLIFGEGTIFKLNLGGNGYQLLKKFTGGLGGGAPYAGVVQADNDVLYGSTIHGGAQGAGVIFKLNPDGSGYEVLTNFAGPTGNQCMATLLQGSDGRLYGTTVSGGSSGKGTVFRLNLDGSGYQVLKHFSGIDGSYAWSSLIQGLDNALYGTAGSGGSSYDAGTVFKLNLDGSGFTVLRRFTGTNGDGKNPKGALVQVRNGTLYGTTSAGGSDSPGVGTVFQLNPDGTGYAVLHSFIQNFNGGFLPSAGLVQVGDGTLYGTASSGGIDQYGTIFSLVPPVVISGAIPGESGVSLSLLGLPGHPYDVQRATAISGPWSSLGSTVLDSDGIGRFEDTHPPVTAAFYRTADH